MKNTKYYDTSAFIIDNGAFEGFDKNDITAPMHLGVGDIFFFVNCLNRPSSPLCKMFHDGIFRGWKIINQSESLSDFQRFNKDDRIVIMWQAKENR